MKQKLLLTLLFCLFSVIGFSQVDIYVPSGTDTTICNGAPLTMQARTNGYVSHTVPTLSDDLFSSVYPIGFTFNFYGNNYTDFIISSNGYISFRTSLAGSSSAWSISSGIPTNANIKNTVCGVFMDLLFSAGGTIAYGVAGVAPSRKLVVNFCEAGYFSTSSCPGQNTTFQIILYETSNIIEIHTKKKDLCTSWNNGYGIQGVENLPATVGTWSPGRNYPDLWTVTVPDGKRFTPDATFSSYTVSDIPYNPVPDSAATIYWYEGSTFLGTGSNMTVNPSTPTTYTAMAVTCGDTSRDMVNVVIGNGPAISSITTTQPSVCGLCDGTITLHGLTPGTSDTIRYFLGSSAMPVFVGVPDAAGDLTIPNMCSGTYTNFTAKVGYCTSAPYAAAVVATPAFSISSVSNTNPNVCGACNATITINGLIPGYTDTVRFIKDGVAQPPVILTVPASGSIIVTNLCAGTYTNITVTMNNCTTPPAGPVTIVNPAFGISDTSSTNASCSACDGTITLYGLTPSQTIIVNYSKDGIPQPSVTLTSSTAGTVTLTNLCPGAYSNITATLNTCVSNPWGTIVISAPPLIPITVTNVVQPTECGICNGRITIKGAPPGPIDTVFFNMNGITQPPVLYSSGPDSTLTIYNLCEGSYNNFFIKVGPCPTTTITTPVVLNAGDLLPSFNYTVIPGCSYDVINFNNTSTSPTGNLWYVWDFGDGTSDTSKNPVHSFPQGNYHVVLTITNHFCDSTFAMDININHPIQAAFTADTLACQLNPVTFTNASTGSAPLSYLWSFGDGTTSTLQDPVHVYSNVGTYTIRLISGNYVPCYDTAYSTIFIDSLSTLSVSLTDTVLCRATYVTMVATYANVGVTGITWSFGDGDSVKEVNPVVYAYHDVGTFNVTTTVGFRICPDLVTTRTITVVPQPNIALGSDTSICPGGEVLQLADWINAPNPAATWLWSTGETTYSILVSTPGTYFAEVTIGNCHATDSIVVAEDCYMNMPNIFTPNGDGINDYFYPRQLLSKGLTGFKMEIYNRWGQMVFSTNAVDGRGWDGKFNGEMQAEDVYVYIIDAVFRDGKKEHHQGNLTLLR